MEKYNYQSPQVRWTEINLDGMLCTSVDQEADNELFLEDIYEGIWK